ncbi:hypothetical protein [Streptomyces sp. MB09-02B]|uniref:hypothetical protein n=1 Tax=Streptomyces sp. MB09-02B TaxID=3028667 RepID=UPI0029BB7853|nr:hypothetical protein [Streptomyces sp. MB09-02B]MDX3645059.1 hypothetical protein [Streptomyces sp. MB09-02B]
MISPEKIPSFTGDLVELQQQIAAMRRAAKAIREHGGDVHTRFQNLSSSYKAPEAGQLFATTQAVESKSSSFADDLDTVANALFDYMVEVAEIVRQLEALRGQARVFVASVEGDDALLQNWQKDQDKVDEHQAIWDAVNATVAAFQQAEVTCADKITALVGGTQWHINDGSPKQDNPYGFNTDQLAEADRLPWGTPAHHEALPFGIDYHLKEFGLSLKDNVVGTVEGVVNLFSPGEEGDATREGLARVIVGAESYLLDPHGDREPTFGPWQEQFMDESRPYAKEFAKGLVGWDDWDDNPGKAAGTLVFNTLTLGAGPLGATAKGLSAAGKGGAGARVAGTLATVGEVLDPIGAAARTVSTAARALPTIREVTTGLHAATDAAAAADATHSVLRLADGSEVRIADGEFIPSKNGVVDTSPAISEPAVTQHTPSAEPPRVREPVGVGTRGNDATAQAGENPPSRAGHDSASGGRDGGTDQQPPARGGSGGTAGDMRGSGAGHSPADGQGPTGSPRAGEAHTGSGAASPDGFPTDPPHGNGGGHLDEGHAAPGAEDPSPEGGSSDGPPDIDPDKYTKNVDDVTQAQTGRMEPEQEAGVVAELDRAKMDARDQASVLRSLRKDPYGAGTADMISRGHLREVEGYNKLLDMCKQGPTKADPKGMVPAVHMAMRLVTDFQAHGVGRVGVELDTATFDLDVYTRHPDGNIDYGYQLKDVTNIAGIKSAARKAAGQLAHEGMSHRVAILDVHQSMRDLTPKMFDEAEFQARRVGGTFILRFTDGSVTVPPDGPTFP